MACGGRTGWVRTSFWIWQIFLLDDRVWVRILVVALIARRFLVVDGYLRMRGRHRDVVSMGTARHVRLRLILRDGDSDS